MIIENYERMMVGAKRALFEAGKYGRTLGALSIARAPVSMNAPQNLLRSVTAYLWKEMNVEC
jgi:hypothetical protein